MSGWLVSFTRHLLALSCKFFEAGVGSWVNLFCHSLQCCTEGAVRGEQSSMTKRMLNTVSSWWTLLAFWLYLGVKHKKKTDMHYRKTKVFIKDTETVLKRCWTELCSTDKCFFYFVRPIYNNGRRLNNKNTSLYMFNSSTNYILQYAHLVSTKTEH